MRRAIRILVVGLFALSILVPAAPLAAASAAPAGYSAADQPTATPTNTAPAGPNLNPEQAPNKSRQKVVIGVFAVVLLVIVFFGRRSKNKRKKKASSATVT
jgi:hypothetical protein